MSTVARRVAATPARTATNTWSVITKLLSREGSRGRAELAAIGGLAASLITDEAFRDAPVVVSESGPQVRIYCVYGEDSIDGNGVNEDVLAFDATAGDWAMSLPCNSENLDWVTSELSKKSKRITARDPANESEANKTAATANAVQIDMEAFLRS
jgi:hypothetical protein